MTRITLGGWAVWRYWPWEAGFLGKGRFEAGFAIAIRVTQYQKNRSWIRCVSRTHSWYLDVIEVEVGAMGSVTFGFEHRL